MGEFVEFIAKKLVASPDEVKVDEYESGRQIIIELNVAPGDMGKVIGRQGRTARAFRTLLKAMATKRGERAVLEIV